MMNESDSNFRNDLMELLAGNALGDLDAVESHRLMAEVTDDLKQTADELHLAAGTLQLLFASQDKELMPMSLRNKIAAAAPNHLSSIAPQAPEQLFVKKPASTVLSRREQLAWLMTAASILFAIGLWASSGTPVREKAVALTPSEARVELIAKADDRIEIPWTQGTTPFDAPVSGDVVWSNSLQTGFLRFVGMPINDASVQQYQLWIIDPLRDDKPIDGGVFDITSEGEVIIPIDAKLAVVGPAAFAVTIEKPGGVVVSDQTRLPLLAKVSDSNG